VLRGQGAYYPGWYHYARVSIRSNEVLADGHSITKRQNPRAGNFKGVTEFTAEMGDPSSSSSLNKPPSLAVELPRSKSPSRL
jgi:hypothetical protein